MYSNFLARHQRRIRAGFARCATLALSVILTLGIVHPAVALPTGPETQAGPFSQDGSIVGVPWTGVPGTTETVAEIMARDAQMQTAAPVTLRETTPVRVWRNPQKKDNPAAPLVSQWPAPATVQPAAVQPNNPQPVGASFLGVQSSESGFVPPDSNGDVGPTQVLIPVNGRIKVFDKTGVLGGLNTTLENFFASVGGLSGASDPHVRYDRLSGRWFVVAISIATTPNHVLIAASSGSTITGAASFTFFQFQHDLVGTTPNTDTGGFADYPTLGVDANALYIGMNIFNAAGTAVIGTTVYVVRKSALLTGSLVVTPFRQIGAANGTGAGPWTPQGVDNDDPGATEGYFVGVDNAAFSQLDVRRVSNPGGTPTLSGNLNITVPTTRLPINVPAQGTSTLLDALDDRLFAAAIHRNKITGAISLWTAHNIQVNASGVGSATGGRDAGRWYEIGNLTTTPSLLQSGTLFDPAATNPRFFWIPSVAMSGQGHMALASSMAGTGQHAEIAAAGRLSGDALGATQAYTLAQSSTFAYNVTVTNPQRWGDFSQTVVDPTDDMTMWTFQEYANATNSWGVRAIQLKAPRPATPSTANPATVSAGLSSITVTVTGTVVSGSGFFDPGPDTGGPGFANHITASVSGGLTVNSVTYTDPTHITLNISTVGATPGLQTVTITNPDGQTASAAILQVNNLVLNPSSTALTSAPNPSVFGQSVTLTATVSGSPGTPTGSVTFYNGGASLGSGTLSGGLATFTSNALAAGTHVITATYSGDSSFMPSASSQLSQVVNRANSTTGLASSPEPSVFGQSVTFTATVSGAGAPPGSGTLYMGNVTFYDGGASLGSGALYGSVVTYTTSALAVGTHTITATYSGDSNITPSTAPALVQRVNQANTTTGLASSPDQSVLGQSVTFKATVSAVAPGAGTPTGSVTFYGDGASLSSGTLSSGVVTYSTSMLTVGTHIITATYSGSISFTSSASNALTFTVNRNYLVYLPIVTR